MHSISHMEVDAEGFLYPFVLSELDAKKIPDYAFVEIKGKWRKKGRYWYLLVTTFRRIEPNYRKEKYQKQFALTGACSHCGRELTMMLWGFDNQGYEECDTCGAWRVIFSDI